MSLLFILKGEKMEVNNLKYTRERRQLSQSELANLSGVSVRMIQAYEQGAKDINKAQVITVLKLAEALRCNVYEIINKDY